MHKGASYRFLIIGILLISLIASSINSEKMNLLNIRLTINFGVFKTTIVYLFLALSVFITTIFLLDKKLVKKNSIVTLLIFYIFYQIVSCIISIVKGQEINAWIATLPFYPIFTLLFLRKKWDFNVNLPYILSKIKLFIYIALLIGIIALISGRYCNYLDLLFISLLFLSFELFQRKNTKALLPVIGLALVSGFNVTWLFTFSFLVILAAIYYLKHLKIHKIVFIFIIAVLVFYIIGSPLISKLNFTSKIPLKERFAQAELLRATGRTALWRKYIYEYKGNLLEILFGHGTGFIYTIPCGDQICVVGHLHNIFLDEFYKRGIIGLLLLLSIIVASLRARAPNYLKVFFILFLIYGLSELIIFKGVLGIVFWITVGMLNNVPKINKFNVNLKCQKIVKIN